MPACTTTQWLNEAPEEERGVAGVDTGGERKALKIKHRSGSTIYGGTKTRVSKGQAWKKEGLRSALEMVTLKE